MSTPPLDRMPAVALVAWGTSKAHVWRDEVSTLCGMYWDYGPAGSLPVGWTTWDAARVPAGSCKACTKLTQKGGRTHE